MLIWGVEYLDPAILWPRDGALDEDGVKVGVDLEHHEAHGGALLDSHVAWHLLPLEHSPWRLSVTSGSHRAVGQGDSVSLGLTSKAPPFHDSLKALSLCGSRHVDFHARQVVLCIEGGAYWEETILCDFKFDTLLLGW